jgi:ectoine hydroxylase-related dioxygenase (phytanoyl-CoA dioxygenase family)
LQKIRNTQRIRIAFEQLWKRKDLWLKIDSAGFNPPQTDDWQFPGHGLHWDVSLQPPIPFSTQGILYLTDTSEEQGAFSLVPGFHHKIDAWLASLRESADPRKEDLEALGVKRIGANAGDMIIWQQALPHGSSPNMSDKPRFAQYINYLPADRQIHPGWK